MKLQDIIENFSLKVATSCGHLDREVRSGYSSDLLSDVIANSKEGDLWITLQTHQNIVAVAKLKDLAAIVIVNNREPAEDTLQKANDEGIPILMTGDPSYMISGKLFHLLKEET